MDEPGDQQVPPLHESTGQASKEPRKETSSTSEERRRSIRAGMRLLTFVKFPQSGKVQRALTRDIGGGGICLATEGNLEPGSTVELEIKLPDRDQSIFCSAEVVWCKQMQESKKSYESPTVETGLKFVKIDPQDQVLIVRYARLNAAL